METYDLIRKTRNLIDNKACWTQYAEARDVRGNPVFAQSSRAALFCVTGGMTHLGSTTLEQLAACKVLKQTEIYKRYEKTSNFLGVEAFNDNQPHANVLRMLDQALLELSEINQINA